MKQVTCIFILFAGIISCSSPLPITANPDDHTNAGGTGGSAKMTNQLPPKNNNVRVKPDSIKMPNDTIRVKQ